MYKYNKQIMVRWASFVLFALASLIIYGLVSSSHPDGISQAVLKSSLTSAAVYADFIPSYIWLLIYAGIFLLLLMGVPTLLLFTPLFLTQGFAIAFITVVIAQLNASIIATFLAKKRNWTKNIPDKLKTKISNLKTPQPAFEFWTRLYNAYPLRTIDLLSAARHGIHPLFKTSVLAALVLRNLFPSIWVASLTNLLVNYTPNPAQDSASFLFWSSILMVYLILPKIPELIICNKEVRNFLEQVESWNLENKISTPEDKAQKPTNKADTQNLNLETQS